MQTVEDILYTCHEEGIKDEVMEIAGTLFTDSAYKNKSAAEVYYDAYVKVNKTRKETRIWESALIKSTEYHFGKSELIIEFNNGSRYAYKNFTTDSYNEFIKAESKGKHFLSEIRKKYLNTENAEKL
jgi:hypothetical protein